MAESAGTEGLTMYTVPSQSREAWEGALGLNGAFMCPPTSGKVDCGKVAMSRIQQDCVGRGGQRETRAIDAHLA